MKKMVWVPISQIYAVHIAWCGEKGLPPGTEAELRLALLNRGFRFETREGKLYVELPE